MSSIEPQPSFSQNHSNDYHQVPATEKQIAYAKQISLSVGEVLPWDAQQDRYALSR
ncbi:MAG: hypothetical protein AB8B94_14195 [Hyphomicrobiales bacterium]